jgi:hypothetical protein
MAKIVTHLSQISDGDQASIEVILPEHQKDDLLLIFVSQDRGDTTLTISDDTWSEISAGQAKSGSTRGAWFYKIAQSDNEAYPTINGLSGMMAVLMPFWAHQAVVKQQF